MAEALIPHPAVAPNPPQNSADVHKLFLGAVEGAAAAAAVAEPSLVAELLAIQRAVDLDVRNMALLAILAQVGVVKRESIV